MHQPLIIQHLFQVSSLEEVSRERLESFVETYPSFGIGHYLLSRKLQAEGSDQFQTEAQRTCLYFSNPLWLQWLLQNGGPALTRETPAVVETVETPVTVEVPQEHSIENVVTMAEDAYVAPAAGDDLAEALTGGETEIFTAVELATITAGEGEDIRDVPVTHAAEATEITGETVTHGENGETSAAELLLRSIEEARGLRETLQRMNEDHSPVTEDLSIETALAGETAPEPVHEAAPEPVQEIAPATHETVSTDVLVHEEPIRDEETPFVLDEGEEVPAETPATAEPAFPQEPVAIAEPAQPAATEPAPGTPVITAPAQDILFEPFHTIDYFASQGIKLTLDDNPVDTLGKQLKSFTEWLKVMRRLPQKDREVVPDRVAEEAIQTYAAHSIQGKDVLTETMAEVLAKQGMREKARAVYEKLSLLNPDKRAYFAAKIEQLNIR